MAELQLTGIVKNTTQTIGASVTTGGSAGPTLPSAEGVAF